MALGVHLLSPSSSAGVTNSDKTSMGAVHGWSASWLAGSHAHLLSIYLVNGVAVGLLILPTAIEMGSRELSTLHRPRDTYPSDRLPVHFQPSSWVPL